MPNLGGVFPLGQGDNCPQLHHMDLKEEEMSAHVAWSMKKGKSPK